jgi:hypothetical protein
MDTACGTLSYVAPEVLTMTVRTFFLLNNLHFSSFSPPLLRAMVKKPTSGLWVSSSSWYSAGSYLSMVALMTRSFEAQSKES